MARYALVIGISKYDKLPNLPKATTDAEAIAQILEQHGDFYKVDLLPKRWVAAQDRYEVAPDKRVTADELFTAIKNLLQEAEKQEVLIYFAGHGFRIASRAGKQRGFLATSDSAINGQNAIALDDDLNALLDQSNLSSLVVLLDCCHAGALLEADLTRQVIEPSLSSFNAPRDFYLITACRAAERSRESTEHGIFTAAVLAGLSSSNANPETGRVSVNRLFDSVYQNLQGSGQEPFQLGGGRSLILVTYPPKGKAIPEIDENVVPYRGLEPFEEDQAKFFFGRRKVVENVWKILDRGNFVAVIGASGSGKSSVVRAGLAPWLKAGGWHIMVMKPGVSPLAKLATVFEPFFENTRSKRQLDIAINIEPQGLRQVANHLSSSQRFLLVVDQFEEVFTLSRLEDRNRFIDLLTQVAEKPYPQLAIVITMRADFLEACLKQYAKLTELIQTQAVLMPLLMGADLEQAIIEPSKQLNYHFESGLLGEILQDVGQEPGCLPLLQFALLELWKQRDKHERQLTRVAYEEMGGVLGALNRHAEELYQNLSESERRWVQCNCLRLIRTGTEEKDTRQRQPKQDLLELAIDPENEEIVNTVLTLLVDERLLVTGEEDGEAWVDLAHEAIMDGWKRFAEWRREDRELRRLRDRVEDALRDWGEHDQDDAFLMSRGLLIQATKKWTDLKIYLSASEQEFYQRSYAYEQEKISYEADITQFKMQLRTLQFKLTERLQQIGEHQRKQVSKVGTFLDQAISEPSKSGEIFESQTTDESKLIALRTDIEDFLGRADHFEKRMSLAHTAVAWINSSREELVELLVQYVITKHPELTREGNFLDLPEKVQTCYGEFDYYIEWLQDSLVRGEPIDQHLALPKSLPKEVCSEAFEFIKQEWLLNKLSSEEAINELNLYIDYLISFLCHFNE